MNIHRWLTIVVALLALTACQTQPAPSPTELPIQATEPGQNTPTAQPTTPTSQPTDTPLPSPTLPPPTPTLAPTPAPFLPELAGISLGNAAQVEQLAVIGRGEIYNLRFTGDSRYLAVDSGSGPLVYDLNSQQPADPALFSSAFPGGSERLVDGQGTRLVTRDGEVIVTVWNTTEHNLQGVSADGSLLAAASYDPPQLEIWDLVNFTQQEAWDQQSPGRTFTLSDFKELPCGIGFGDGPGAGGMMLTSLAVHPQAPSPLLAGNCNQQSLVFFTMEGDLLGEYPLPEDSFLLQLAFSPDGSRAAGFLNRTHVTVWQVSDGAVLVDLRVPAELHQNIFGFSRGLAISPDNRWVSLALSDGSLLLWDSQAPGDPFRLHDSPPIASGMSFSPDGSVLAYSTRRAMVLFDLQRGAPLQKLDPNPKSEISGCAFDILFSPDGRYVICQGVRTVAWDVTDSASQAIPMEVKGPLALLDNPPRLVDYTMNRIALYSLPDWQIIETIAMNNKFTGAYAFAPSGDQLALSYDDEIQIIQRKDKKWKNLTSFAGQRVYRLFFSPLGNLLAAGTEAIENETMEALSVYSLETNERLYRLRMEFPREGDNAGSAAFAAVFSPDGQLLATGAGRMLKLYSSASGGRLESFSGHTDSIVDVRFSPDGRLIATLGRDGTLRLWGIKGE